MEKQTGCDIIIPTYNGSAHLPRLLESISRQSFRNFECFVIDDNSSDITVALVRRDFPWVHLIAQPVNMGPAHNRNVAIAAGSSPYIVIFDDDAYLDDVDWLGKAIARMEADPGVGQLAAMIVNGFDPEILLDCGIAKNWYLFGGIFHNVRQQDARGKHTEARAVLGACSAGTILRRTLFDLVGGFDAGYFYPCEDLDLSLRIHLAGSSVCYEPGLKVFHYESQAMGKSLARKMYLYRRNSLVALSENFPLPHVLLMFLAVLGREVMLPAIRYLTAAITAREKGAFPRSVMDFPRALVFVARRFPDILRKRACSNRFRIRPRGYLLRVNRELMQDLAR